MQSQERIMNQRAIKFRAWDLVSSRMVVLEDFYFRKEYTNISGIRFHVGLDKSETRAEGEDLILMQFTGLHDSNGKEIFEGDLVKGGPNSPLRVEYRNGAFSGYSQDTEMPYPIDEFGSGKTEVVGNIYENPELLSINRK